MFLSLFKWSLVAKWEQDTTVGWLKTGVCSRHWDQSLQGIHTLIIKGKFRYSRRHLWVHSWVRSLKKWMKTVWFLITDLFIWVMFKTAHQNTEQIQVCSHCPDKDAPSQQQHQCTLEYKHVLHRHVFTCVYVSMRIHVSLFVLHVKAKHI